MDIGGALQNTFDAEAAVQTATKKAQLQQFQVRLVFFCRLGF